LAGDSALKAFETRWIKPDRATFLKNVEGIFLPAD
jgi:hypothetical protein